MLNTHAIDDRGHSALGLGEWCHARRDGGSRTNVYHFGHVPIDGDSNATRPEHGE